MKTNPNRIPNHPITSHKKLILLLMAKNILLSWVTL